MTSRLEQARAALARAEAVASARAYADLEGDPASPDGQVSADEAAARRAARPGRRGSRPDRARGRVEQGDLGGGASPPPEQPDGEADPEAVARGIVLRQLTMAPRSRAQLEDKLRARNCPDDVATRVLDRFTELGLVDDQAYADTLVRTRREAKGLARRALAHELRRKGVGEDIVAESLSGIESDEEEDQARRLVDKRLRALHGLDAAVQTRRLAGMLARKGYSSALSYRVIRQALAESPEHRRD